MCTIPITMHSTALETLLSVHLGPSEKQKPLQILILRAAVSVIGAVLSSYNKHQKHKCPALEYAMNILQTLISAHLLIIKKIINERVVKFSKWNINNWNPLITIHVIIYFSWQEKKCLLCNRAREETETQLRGEGAERMV